MFQPRLTSPRPRLTPGSEEASFGQSFPEPKSRIQQNKTMRGNASGKRTVFLVLLIVLVGTCLNGYFYLGSQVSQPLRGQLSDSATSTGRIIESERIASLQDQVKKLSAQLAASEEETKRRVNAATEEATGALETERATKAELQTKLSEAERVAAAAQADAAAAAADSADREPTPQSAHSGNVALLYTAAYRTDREILSSFPEIECPSCVPSLWPLPVNVDFGEKAAFVSANVECVWTNDDGDETHRQDIVGVCDRFRRKTFPKKTTRFSPELASGNAHVKQISVTVTDMEAPLEHQVDESYTLSQTVTGIDITAVTQWGLRHALETLSQCISFEFEHSLYAVRAVPSKIVDSPRFPHRGVMIDSARHFLPVPFIKRIIDSLVLAKYNVLHWHATDHQSFPLEVPNYPKLWDGAFSKGERYLVTDVQDISQYAHQRGVRVVLEIDVPGHTESWCTGYPEICVDPDFVEKDYDWNLNPLSPKTFEIIEAVLTTYANFTDKMLHLGGDEVIQTAWKASPHITEMRKETMFSFRGDDAPTPVDEGQMFEYFWQQVWKISKKLNKTLVLWEESFMGGIPNWPEDAIIQSWHQKGFVPSQARQGRVIASNYPEWYLDQTYLWDKFYSYEPYDLVGNQDDTPALEANIIGGEVCMWAEMSDINTMLSAMWPRAAAAAERMWSPKTVTSLEDAKPRLERFRCRLHDFGIPAERLEVTGSKHYSPPGAGSCDGFVFDPAASVQWRRDKSIFRKDGEPTVENSGEFKVIGEGAGARDLGSDAAGAAQEVASESVGTSKSSINEVEPEEQEESVAATPPPIELRSLTAAETAWVDDAKAGEQLVLSVDAEPVVSARTSDSASDDLLWRRQDLLDAAEDISVNDDGQLGMTTRKLWKRQDIPDDLLPSCTRDIAWNRLRDQEIIALRKLAADKDKFQETMSSRDQFNIQWLDDEYLQCEEFFSFPVAETAIISVDMWYSHWCDKMEERGASLAPFVNQTLNAARSLGIHVIHTHAFNHVYENNASLPFEHVVRDRTREYISIPDDDYDQAFPSFTVGRSCKMFLGRGLKGEQSACDGTYSDFDGPWTQSPAVIINDSDSFIPNDRKIFYKTLKALGIKHLLYVGVHTNFCIMDNETGSRVAMGLGLLDGVYLAREATDAGHNPITWPFLKDRPEVNELAVNCFENTVGSSFSAMSLVKANGLKTLPEGAPPPGRHPDKIPFVSPYA